MVWLGRMAVDIAGRYGQAREGRRVVPAGQHMLSGELVRLRRPIVATAPKRAEQAENAQHDQPGPGQRHVERERPSEHPRQRQDKEHQAEDQRHDVGAVPLHRRTSSLPRSTVASMWTCPPPTPSAPLSVMVRFRSGPPMRSPNTSTSPRSTDTSTTASTFGGRITVRRPRSTLTAMSTRRSVKSTWDRSSVARPTSRWYRGSISATVAGAQTAARSGSVSPMLRAALLVASTSASTRPGAMSQRARPNQAPTNRPNPTVASAIATYPGPLMLPPARSIAASTPSVRSMRDKVMRPNGERGRGGRGGSGGVTGGAPPRPGYVVVVLR